ncbi:MAG: hypothetical protein EZS28_018703 [Streblomastix strix]|uniref:Uncharacterized protein n=1 Tax=Streblomastix strix TaxID=222440 RepID=A0A5J4VTN4_9EUKA|nr:MAG: hypothetical protein EZS28_018703 [Streblomastix strix]
MMAFTKLLLVLAVLSFGKPSILNRKAGATHTTGNLYYNTEKLDKNGVLTLDLTGYKNGTDFEPVEGVKKITDYKIINSTAKEADDSYYVVKDEATLEKLQTSLALAPAEIACPNVAYAHDYDIYGIIGYTIYAIDGTDIAPSLTHIYKNGPTKITYKNIPEGLETVFADQTITPSCSYLEESLAYAYGINKAGVVDAKCVPNSGIPAESEKCTTDATYKAYIKGYRLGYFTGDKDTVKSLLLRFGPVQIGSNIVIGWEKVDTIESWILAVPEYTGEPPLHTLTYTYGWDTAEVSEYKPTYDGYVLFNGVSVIRAALGLLAAVLVLPALLL